MHRAFLPAVFWGTAAALLLLGIYFGTVSLISGYNFALKQFGEFWYFIASLSVGFGIQVGLFTYLRTLVKAHALRGAGGAVAVSGASSTVAMISCCAHYVANLVPILGISGFLTAVGQYQKELFWVGLASNVGGIGYISKKLFALKKQYDFQ